MRILYIQPAEAFGGAERQGVVHVRRLLDLGHDVVPVVGPGQRICEALEREGVHDYVFVPDFVSQAGKPRTVFERASGALSTTRSWLHLHGLLDQLIRQHRIQLVFASRSAGWATASSPARRAGVPLVWRGGSRITSRRETGLLRLLVGLCPPDAFVSNCEAVRRDLAALVRCPCHILPNGVDLARFDPARVAPRVRRDLGLDARTPVVGVSARPAPGKGLEFLAEVLRVTAAEVPSLRLLVAGESGWRGHYERLFAELRLQDRVTFLGYVGDIESFYASCDVVVLASRQKSVEGSPNALLEAMAMERPVVATNVGGVAETLRDQGEGYLIDPSDVGGFAGRVISLCREPSTRRRLGTAGRATVMREHDDRVVTQRLSDICTEVLERAAQRVSSGRRPRRWWTTSPEALSGLPTTRR
jgi:glycosyltransferase involved in cell wall biosynthesis